MKKNNNAFTLIEMIVGVSITMILMISVGVFVSSGMNNITIQKQILDRSSEIGNLNEDLNNIFGQNFEIISNTSTSILVKSNYILGKPSYYNISEISSTGYCENEPNIENTYLQIKNFNPFILSGSIYSGSYIQNIIYSGGQVIAGKGVFGEQFTDGSIGTGIYLNNPASITNSGNLLFISDSGNNKILYMSGNKIYKLLDIDDGIYNPTGILYNAGNLYILNSGKNEVLVLSSQSNSSNPIDLTITPTTGVNIDKIDIEVLPNDFILNGTYNSGSFGFGGTITTNTGDTVSQTNNKLTYNFVGGNNSLTSGGNYSINIPTFDGTLSNGNYYLKVNLYNGVDSTYEKYFPYVVNADNDLTTIYDNTLTVLTGGLLNNYFSDLSFSGGNLLLKDFIKGKYLELTQTGIYVGTGNLSILNIDDFENITKISDFKIKDFKIINDGKLLTIKIEYYKNFSCYNDKDSVIKTMILKKAIK